LRRTKSGFEGTVTTFLTVIASPLPIVTTPGDSVLVGDWRSGTIYRIRNSSSSNKAVR
jgi:hypothetical protein